MKEAALKCGRNHNLHSRLHMANTMRGAVDVGSGDQSELLLTPLGPGGICRKDDTRPQI